MEVKNIFFIAEQDGAVEREFKAAIIEMLSRQAKNVRAYLAQVSYESSIAKEFNVAICFKEISNCNQELLEETIQIFKNMFGAKEHLDIIFLDDAQEAKLREVCCPFFVLDKYQFVTPDFYLTSSEGYDLKTPNKKWLFS